MELPCDSLGLPILCSLEPVTGTGTKLCCVYTLRTRYVTVYIVTLAYCWFSVNVTGCQTTKLSILLRFHFHGVLEYAEN